MDVKQGHSGDTSGHGISGSGSQSQQSPQAPCQASASTDRTQRPLTGPEVWPAWKDVGPCPRVCSAGEAWGGACAAGRRLGGTEGRPWPGGPQGERVGCVRPERQEPLPWPQRKEKGAPIWQGMGSSNRAQREHRSWPGSALPPGQHLQHPTPFASQGMDSRGNGQRREITVEFIGCDSIRREHRQRPRHAGGGAGVGTDGQRTSTSTLGSALGRPTR